jgi:hypothetical protein
MQPYVGQIVLYRLRPGQVRAGQSELAAIVTRVHTRPDGEDAPCVDLRVFVPDSVDPLVQPRVMALSAAVRGHGWRPTDAPGAANDEPKNEIKKRRR